MITVFTPTYNRAYILPQLYGSLCRQTSKDFEWLVIDDGSTDNTEELVAGWIAEKKIPIRYFKKENGGKHRAINRGVEEAKGELFFIVDSDDYLTDDAVEWMSCEWSKISDNPKYCGISGYRISPSGKPIGGDMKRDFIDCSSVQLRMIHKISGDMAEAWRTDYLKQSPFPEFEGEKFCPESMVWNRLSRNYIMRFCSKGIYVCEYLADGLTAKITRIRMQSPKASMLYYSELYRMDIPLSQKIKAAINYWRFALCSDCREDRLPMLGNLMYPLGLLMHIKDKKQFDV